jgi:hypothetical protein
MTRSQDIRARNPAKHRLNSTKWTDATMAVILTSVKASHACNDKQRTHPTGFSFTFLVERIRAGSRHFCNLSMKGRVYIFGVYAIVRGISASEDFLLLHLGLNEEERNTC